MDNELAQMQTQLNRLGEELRVAQHTIRKLEGRRVSRRLVVALLCLLAFVWVVTNSRTKVEASLQDSSVRAPFTVMGKDGKMLLAVSEDAGGFGKLVIGSKEQNVAVEISGNGTLRLKREDGSPAVEMIASEDGADLIVEGKSKDKHVHLTSWSGGADVDVQNGSDASAMVEATDKRTGFSARSQGKDRAFVGGSSDGGALNIYGADNKPVATLQSDAGDGKLWVNDKSGQPVVGVFAGDNGGVVKVMKSGDATTYTAINAIDKGLGLMVRKSGARKSYVGTTESGSGAIYVFGANDSPVAGLMSSSDGRGLVAVFNSSTKAIAFLSESDKHAGAGNVTVTDPAGNGVVSAGFTGEGGDVCVDHKSTLRCLGVGLPLQMN